MNKKVKKTVNDYKFVFLSIIIFLVILWIMRDFIIDDSFITFRYSRHLAEGYNLVWNYPPFKPVEGYSSFLWAILMSISFPMGIDTLIFSKICGTIFGISIIFLTYLLARRIFDNKKIAGISTLFIALMPVFPLWSVSGMETAMAASLFLAGLFFFFSESIRKRILSSILFALFAMTRPEGVIFFLVLLGIDFFADYFETKKINLKNPLIILAFFSLIYAPFFIWKWSFYGYPMPNPAYVKINGIVVKHGLTIVYTLPLYFLMLFSIPHLKRNGRTLLLMVIAWIFVSMIVGTMMMYPLRFFIPMLPLLGILSAKGLHEVFKINNIKIKFAVLVLFLIVMTNPFGINTDPPYNIVLLDGVGPSPTLRFMDDYFSENKWVHEHNNKVSQSYVPFGKWLGENVDKNTIMVTGECGAIPFYSDINTIDYLGLNDEYIAHYYPGVEAPAPDYIFSFNPELIILSGNKTEVSKSFSIYMTHEKFSKYILKGIVGKGYENWYLWVYVRNDSKIPPLPSF